MSKPERLAGAVLALAAVFMSGAYIKASGYLGAASASHVIRERAGVLLALCALIGGCFFLGLTLALVRPARRKIHVVAGFRPAKDLASGLAPVPAKFRPPLPGRYGKVTAQPPERHFAELPRPGYSKPMIVHKIYPQAPVVTRLDKAHLYWAMRLLSDKRAHELKPRRLAAPRKTKAAFGKLATARTALRVRPRPQPK